MEFPMGVYKKKFTSFHIPYLKIHTHSVFYRCIVKKSLKTILRQQNQSTSKNFNQMGGNFGENFGQKLILVLVSKNIIKIQRKKRTKRLDC